MSKPFKVACIQMTTDRDVGPSMDTIERFAREARDAGADLITTPECASMIEAGRKNVLAKAVDESQDESLARFRALASETGAWMLAGSLIIKVEPERCANRSFLIDPNGNVVSRYDKIHMFDVDLEGGESYRESRTYRPGERAVIAPTPWGPLGMTICYDMRFPHLYRHLAQAGAKFLTVPSAFTRPTGRAHWHTLLRARAIETGCYVIAPAQCGVHPSGRKTYGHSVVIDPWGAIIAEAGEQPEVILATIDPARVDEVRGQVPSLNSQPTFTPVAPHDADDASTLAAAGDG
jgi:predicted amidohydrolase